MLEVQSPKNLPKKLLIFIAKFSTPKCKNNTMGMYSKVFIGECGMVELPNPMGQA
jgi:hypothetical protein